MANNWLFNTNQLATREQARVFAQKLGAGPIVVGNGVKPETADNKTSGIYTPEWSGGPGGFEEPHYTDPLTGELYFFLHYRFQNGGEGMNVGLIMAKFRSYPMSPGYVLWNLAQEANSLSRGW